MTARVSAAPMATPAQDQEHSAPILGHADLSALHEGLLQIRSEAATWPDEPEWHIRCSSQVALIISQEAAAAWR